MGTLITPGDWASFTGRTLSGTETASVQAVIAGVDAAVRKACSPVLFEATAISGKAGVVDAPPDEVLVAPWRPILISSLAIRQNTTSNGDPAAFAATDALTEFTHYNCPSDEPTGLYSLSGRIRRVNTLWGAQRIRSADSLASRLVAGRSWVRLAYTAGFATVPEDVRTACFLMTSLLMERRLKGAPLSSESWNGGSLAFAGQFTASAAIYSPDVFGLLRKYMPACVIAGGNG